MNTRTGVSLATLSLLLLLSGCGTEPASFGDEFAPESIPGTVSDGSADPGTDAGVNTGADAGADASVVDGGSADTGTVTLDASIEPLDDVSGGDDVDELVDAVADAVAPGEDTVTAPDLVDGQVCVPGSVTCDETGLVLLTCSDDGQDVGRIRCVARDAYCGEDRAGNAACIERACEPGALSCSPDGSSVVACNEIGSGFSDVVEECDNGCADDGVSCAGGTVDPPDPTTCDLADFTLLTPGDVEFSLCDESNSASNAQSDACRFNYEGNDRTFALVLTEPTDVVLDLRDNDGGAAIDTVLYIRGNCDDAASQIACDDDVSCDSSDIDTGGCVDGSQPRQSRLELSLDAGTYYVVADQYSYTSRRTGTRFGCGDVLLRYSVN